MPSAPHAQNIREVLTDSAESVFKRLAAGDDEAVIATDLGVYPAQMRKFYAAAPEYRELYRDALDASQQLQALARQKKKATQPKGGQTQLEKIAQFAEDILDMLREGALIREIARGYEVQYSTIGKYFNVDETRKAAYAEALTEGGHALAEKSVEVTMAVALDGTDAKVMDTRSARLAWLAAKRNAVYDNQQKIQHSGTMVSSVSIDISTGD